MQSKKVQIEYARVEILLYVEMFESGVFKNVENDIQELKKEIERLEKQIKGFDLDTAMQKAKLFISENMNRLAKKLDF